jgi:predicted dehydrogenase
MPDNVEAVALIGVGGMGQAYAKVLQAQNTPFVAIGRRDGSATAFEAEFEIPVTQGGVTDWISKTTAIPARAIVAVNVAELASTTLQLMKAGCRSILVEKPAGLDKTEIGEVAELADRLGAQVFVAYNRRFYSSIQSLREQANRDGGLISINFDFSEVGREIETLPHPDSVKNNWFLANSTHVVDAAFFLAGLPVVLEAHVSGGLPWHPKGEAFTGAGVTDKDVLFSYHANWRGPGRWGIQAVSAEHRFVLQPMESLMVQKHGSFSLEDIHIENKLDLTFKPGLYLQVKAFLDGDNADLLCIQEQRHQVEGAFLTILNGDKNSAS